jgi:hypothetical protein
MLVALYPPGRNLKHREIVTGVSEDEMIKADRSCN